MRRVLLLLTVVLASLTLAACGSSSTTKAGGASQPAADHNAADVAFAQMMIPHHQQAVQMAELATSRAGSPQVKTLAGQIRGAQDPEIQTMTGWLTSWGQPTGMPGMAGHSGHGMGSMSSMPGMMSDADMTRLATLSGPQFDREWLTMMTAHHTGAIEMARTEQAQGSYPPATTLAGNIITSQSAEIQQMKSLQTAKL